MSFKDIAIEFGNKFNGSMVPIFNSNTTNGTPIFLINIENGIPKPYCTTVEHFFGDNDYLDLAFVFKDLDKDNELYFVVNDGNETEVFVMNRDPEYIKPKR